MADKSERGSSIRRKKSFQGHQYRRKLKHTSEQYSANLWHVAGLTLKSHCAFSCDELSGNIAFPAGCVIVVCQVRQKKQFHIFNPGRKQLTCLQFSRDGLHLVTGESGHLPCVRVFSVPERCQVASFQSHKFGISCVIFAPNSKYIVSVGYQHDNVINVWDWRKSGLAASNKVSIKVRAVSFAENSEYFVTAGNRHVKFWYIEQNDTAENSTVPLKGRSAILGTARNHMFCDVACGVGCDELYTFTLTRSGMICRFNEKRIMDNCVQTDAASTFCMSVVSGMIVCGCGDGKILLYSTTDLSIVSTFNSCDAKAEPQDVIVVDMDSKNMWLHCVHSGHSLYTWDLLDFTNPVRYNSSDFHFECIWDIKALSTSGDSSYYYTCANDGTARMWLLTPDNECISLKCLQIDGETTSTSSDKSKKIGVRSLCISEDGSQLTIGDRGGVVHMYETSDNIDTQQKRIKLHDGDILCLDGNAQHGLLASSSRDRCIHLLDKNGVPKYTINDHSAAVTAIRFVATPDSLRLISCSIDKSLYFGTVEVKGDTVEVVRDQHVVGKRAMHDMAIVKECVLVACGSLLFEYDIKSGKMQRSIKTNESSANILRVTVDDDGSLIAVSCADKLVYILAYQTGDLLMELCGHSEMCTALQFLMKNSESFLITASADSCIFIWKLRRCESDCADRENALPVVVEESIQNGGDLDMSCYFRAEIDVTPLLAECATEDVAKTFVLDEGKNEGSVEHNTEQFGGMSTLDVSLPTWITGKTERTPKSRMPGGKWAGRIQDDDVITPYEDCHADQTLLDTPNTTQPWGVLEDDDESDVELTENAEVESPCLSVKAANDCDTLDPVPVDPIVSVNDPSATGPTLDLHPEEVNNTKTCASSESDAHFNSILSQNLSGEYVSACEESGDEIQANGKSLADELQDLGLSAVNEMADPIGFEPTKLAIDDSHLLSDSTITSGMQSHDREEGNEAEANAESNRGIDNVTHTGSAATAEKGIVAIEEPDVAEKAERLSSGSTDDKPIPPAFASFLDNIAKKKPRTPRSLPLVKIHEQGWNGIGKESDVTDIKPMSKEGNIKSRSSTGSIGLREIPVRDESLEKDSECPDEIAQSLLRAFEKAENLYKKVTSNGCATDHTQDSVRAMLSSTFISLQSRILDLGFQGDKHGVQVHESLESPPVLAMLKEYSDKLLYMMGDKMGRDPLMEK